MQEKHRKWQHELQYVENVEFCFATHGERLKNALFGPPHATVINNNPHAKERVDVFLQTLLAHGVVTGLCMPYILQPECFNVWAIKEIRLAIVDADDHAARSTIIQLCVNLFQDPLVGHALFEVGPDTPDFDVHVSQEQPGTPMDIYMPVSRCPLVLEHCPVAGGVHELCVKHADVDVAQCCMTASGIVMTRACRKAMDSKRIRFVNMSRWQVMLRERRLMDWIQTGFVCINVAGDEIEKDYAHEEELTLQEACAVTTRLSGCAHQHDAVRNKIMGNYQDGNLFDLLPAALFARTKHMAVVGVASVAELRVVWRIECASVVPVFSPYRVIMDTTLPPMEILAPFVSLSVPSAQFIHHVIRAERGDGGGGGGGSGNGDDHHDAYEDGNDSQRLWLNVSRDFLQPKQERTDTMTAVVYSATLYVGYPTITRTSGYHDHKCLSVLEINSAPVLFDRVRKALKVVASASCGGAGGAGGNASSSRSNNITTPLHRLSNVYTRTCGTVLSSSSRNAVPVRVDAQRFSTRMDVSHWWTHVAYNVPFGFFKRCLSVKEACRKIQHASTHDSRFGRIVASLIQPTTDTLEAIDAMPTAQMRLDVEACNLWMCPLQRCILPARSLLHNLCECLELREVIPCTAPRRHRVYDRTRIADPDMDLPDVVEEQPAPQPVVCTVGQSLTFDMLSDKLLPLLHKLAVLENAWRKMASVQHTTAPPPPPAAIRTQLMQCGIPYKLARSPVMLQLCAQLWQSCRRRDLTPHLPFTINMMHMFVLHWMYERHVYEPHRQTYRAYKKLLVHDADDLQCVQFTRSAMRHAAKVVQRDMHNKRLNYNEYAYRTALEEYRNANLQDLDGVPLRPRRVSSKQQVQTRVLPDIRPDLFQNIVLSSDEDKPLSVIAPCELFLYI